MLRTMHDKKDCPEDVWRNFLKEAQKTYETAAHFTALLWVIQTVIPRHPHANDVQIEADFKKGLLSFLKGKNVLGDDGNLKPELVDSAKKSILFDPQIEEPMVDSEWLGHSLSPNF